MPYFISQSLYSTLICNYLIKLNAMIIYVSVSFPKWKVKSTKKGYNQSLIFIRSFNSKLLSTMGTRNLPKFWGYNGEILPFLTDNLSNNHTGVSDW